MPVQGNHTNTGLCVYFAKMLAAMYRVDSTTVGGDDSAVKVVINHDGHLEMADSSRVRTWEHNRNGVHLNWL